MKALIVNGKVAELHAEGFPVHPDWTWVDAPDEVKVGWGYADGKFTAPVLSPDEIIASLTAAVQSHLDATARSRGYDGILSACTYTDDPIPKFAAEGQACKTWRGAVWAACYAHMDKVMAGKAPVPSKEELLALLPKMVWPT
jgi:hypothetical protein